MNTSVSVQKKGFIGFIVKHKIFSIVIAIIVALVLYFAFSLKANSGPSRYSLVQAQKGTLILTSLHFLRTMLVNR